MADNSSHIERKQNQIKSHQNKRIFEFNIWGIWTNGHNTKPIMTVWRQRYSIPWASSDDACACFGDSAVRDHVDWACPSQSIYRTECISRWNLFDISRLLMPYSIDLNVTPYRSVGLSCVNTHMAWFHKFTRW